MYKIFICLTVLFVSTTTLFADRVKINDKGIVDVEFESIEVGAGSFDSQIFIIGNIESEIRGVMGFADIGGDYGSYERQLPITSTYDNPAHYFTVSLAYSESDKAVICIRECWNNSEEDYEFPGLYFELRWLILK